MFLLETNYSEDDNKFTEIMSLNVFPNPNNGKFKFEFISNFSGSFDIVVTDILGREVYSRKIKDYFYYQYSDMDLSYLPEGIYLITIRKDHLVFTTKLIIQK